MSKITHENIQKVVSRTYNALVYYFNDDNALKFEREIQDYIKQQERDSKLLELYKELATLYRDRFNYTNSATEIERLWGKIKELEKCKNILKNT